MKFQGDILNVCDFIQFFVFTSNHHLKHYLLRNVMYSIHIHMYSYLHGTRPGRVAQSVGHLTRKSGVLGSIPGLATYFRFSFRFFKEGSCQLLAKVCARSTG